MAVKNDVPEPEDEDEIFDSFEEYCDEIAKANKEWHDRWPDACETCEGAGGFHCPGSWEEPSGWDLCSDCIMHDLCPRCMTTFPELGYEGPCPNCKWNWCEDKDSDDAAPQIN